MLGNLAKNFSFLVLGRIGSRIADFVLKILIVRSLNPKIFASTVHFQLILNVSLFYAKNCLKNCYQKQQRKTQQNLMIKNSSNLMILGIPITMLLAGMMVILQIVFNSDSQHLEYFAITSAIYGLSSIMESVYEVTICKLVHESNYQKMTQIEIICLLIKSVVMWVAVYLNLFQKYGVLIFGISQITFSFVLMVFGMALDPSSLKLSKLPPSGEYISAQLKQFVKQFTLVNFIKLIMQEVEKIVMVMVNDVQILSVFSLVSNLGSIIARFIFQPLEEIAYNIFAKSKNNQEVKFVLQILLKILIVFGTILFLFGTLYSQSLLSLLYGESWATQAAITGLSSYCLYILFMGVNGICESFVYARIEPEQIGRFRNYMMLGTVIYIACAVLSIMGGYGASGIFIASSLVTLFRILICWKIFIYKLYNHGIIQWIQHITMKKLVFAVYILSFIVLYPLRNRYHPFVNLLIGAGIALVNLGVTAYLQRQTLRNVKNIAKIQNKVE